MTIYVFSLPASHTWCKRLCSYLEQFGLKCTEFTQTGAFYTQILDKEKLPDIYLLDYYIYNHYVFNIFSFMKENSAARPVIFFNDPQPKIGTASAHWLNLHKLIFSESEINLKKYETAITLIGNFIDSEANLANSNQKCVQITQNESTLDESQSSAEEQKIQFQKTLPALQLHIFRKLCAQSGKTVSVKELQNAAEDGILYKKATVACGISRLRKQFESQKITTFGIIKNADGYKLINYAE